MILELIAGVIVGAWVLGKIGEYLIWRDGRNRYLRSIGYR